MKIPTRVAGAVRAIPSVTIPMPEGLDPREDNEETQKKDEGEKSSKLKKSRVVILSGFRSQSEAEVAAESIRPDCEKCGSIKNFKVIPISSDGARIFIQFSEDIGAARAHALMDQRVSAAVTISSAFFDEDKFEAGDYTS